MDALVRPLRAEEIGRASRLLAVAFADDPFIGHFFVHRRRRELAFPAFFAAVLHQLVEAGGVFALETDTELAGVAAWAPPDGADPSRQSRRLARIASLQVSALFPRASPRLHAGFDALGASHPAHPHWYLAFVGIDPRQQRRGFGRTILTPVLEHADHEAVPCYLETPFPDTRPFYQALGFREAAELRPVPGAPPIWTMTRPAPPRQEAKHQGVLDAEAP
jgi:GNAT superfamily N-acetyltransferase